MENHYGFIALLAYLWVTLVFFSKFLDREDEAVRGLRGEDEQQKAMLFRNYLLDRAESMVGERWMVPTAVATFVAVTLAVTLVAALLWPIRVFTKLSEMLRR